MEIEARYWGYIKKANAEIERINRARSSSLPQDVDYGEVPGLSAEAVEKLNKAKPGNIERAMRVPGVSPADIIALYNWLRKSGVRG